MILVSDTHPFLWYLTDDDRLSDSARTAFSDCEKGKLVIAIPTAVLMECANITERYNAAAKFEKIVESIESSRNYVFCPLDLKVVKKMPELKKLSEPHDKMVVATAQILGAPVITDNNNIRNSGYVDVVW